MDTTLLKGLSVLEALAGSKEPRGVTELSGELRLLKSNVHRVLQTLLHVGYVRKDPDSGRYECTLKLWSLAGQAVERFDVRRVARPHMKRLWDKTGENIHLGMLEGLDVLYIDRLESRHPVRVNMPPGGRGPAVAISSGKMLLAYADESTQLLAARNLMRYTARSIVDSDAFHRELRKIKAAGHVINRGEYREGVSGISAPLLDDQGKPLAAIGISVPSERFTTALLKDLLPRVLSTARAISAELGHRAPAASDGAKLRRSAQTVRRSR